MNFDKEAYDMAHNVGYEAGYEDALDDYHALAMQKLDIAAPKSWCVCGWLRGQLRGVFNALREEYLG